MPTYLYQCKRCNEELHVTQPFMNSLPQYHCDLDDTYCEGKLIRRYREEGTIGVIYKSIGFTTTDKRFDPVDDE